MGSIRDRVKAVQDRRTEPYTVKDWNDEKVLLAGLDNDGQAWLVGLMIGKEHDEVMAEIIRNAPGLVRQGVLDPETREPVFKAGDEDWLRHKSGHVIGEIALKIVDLTKIMGGDDEVDAAKNVSAPDPAS